MAIRIKFDLKYTVKNEHGIVIFEYPVPGEIDRVENSGEMKMVERMEIIEYLDKKAGLSHYQNPIKSSLKNWIYGTDNYIEIKINHLTKGEIGKVYTMIKNLQKTGEPITRKTKNETITIRQK
jgi:hypothetical protein